MRLGLGGIGLSRGLGVGMGVALGGGGGQAWTPAQPTTSGGITPFAWYEASAVTGVADGADVATWPDSGTGGRDGTQSNSAIRPSYAASQRAGKPALSFAGSDDCFVVPLQNAATSHTFFCVIKGITFNSKYLLDNSSPRLILAMIDNAGFNDSIGWYDGTWQRVAPLSEGWQIARWRFDAGSSMGEIWLNGYLLGSAVYSPRALGATVVLGNANAQSGGLGIKTDMAGFLYYAAAASDLDCAEIEAYLAERYRLSIAGNASSGNETTPTAAEPGIWSWFTNPRAVHHSGTRDQTYFGAMEGADCVAYALNHTTGRIESFTLRASLGQDDHNNPSFLVRESDKRILAFYSAHNGSAIYQRISAVPEDVTAWRAEQNLDASLGNDRYSYPCPVQLTGEVDDPIYLFYRAWPTGDPMYCYSKSIDGGETWSAGVEIFDNGTQRPYVHLARNGTDRIDFVVTDGHPDEVATNSIYHCYYTGGNLYQTDGTLIGALNAGPYTPATHMTLVYDGTTVSGWNWDIAIDGSGHPVIVYAAFPTTTDHRYCYARWNGSSWSNTEIVAGGSYLYGPGASEYYSGGICLDHADVDTVYVSMQVSGQWEIVKYTTADNGATWDSGTAITSGSSAKNIRPFVPLNASDDLRVLWCNGTYTTYIDYDMDLHSEPSYF